MKIVHLALSGAILLAGCVTSNGTSAVHPMSKDAAARGRVTLVQLHNTPSNVSGDFTAQFQNTVQSKLNECADGDYPLVLTVTLNGYHSANAAIALFAPSQSEISGVARLTDASGAVVGEYNIRRTIMVGGVIGAVVAANAEQNMSSAFGEELCKQAFKKN
jgi:hypothetical protein